MSKYIWLVDPYDGFSEIYPYACESKKEATKLCKAINNNLWIRGISSNAVVVKRQVITKAKEVKFDKYVRFEVPVDMKNNIEPISYATDYKMFTDEETHPEVSHLVYDLINDTYWPTLKFSMEATKKFIKSDKPENNVRLRYNRVLNQFRRSLAKHNLTIEGIKSMPEGDKIHIPHSIITDGCLLVFASEKAKKTWMDYTGYSPLDEDDYAE